MARVDPKKVGKDFSYLPGELEYYQTGKLPDYPADWRADLPEPAEHQEPEYFEGQGFLRPGPPFKLGHRCVLCGEIPAAGSWTCRAHPWGPGLRYDELLENVGVNDPGLLRVKESWGLPDDTNPNGLMAEAFPIIALEAEEGSRRRALALLRIEAEAAAKRFPLMPHYIAMLRILEQRLEAAADWPKGRPDNPFGIRIVEPREEELQFPAWQAYQRGAEALLAGNAEKGRELFAEARRLWNANRSGSGDLGRALVEAAKASTFAQATRQS